MHAADATSRGEATGCLLLPLGPFYWAVTAFLLICLPTQVVVALTRVRDALPASDRSSYLIALTGFAAIAVGTFGLFLAEPAISELDHRALNRNRKAGCN